MCPTDEYRVFDEVRGHVGQLNVLRIYADLKCNRLLEDVQLVVVG